jgi:hypothetical protein
LNRPTVEVDSTLLNLQVFYLAYLFHVYQSVSRPAVKFNEYSPNNLYTGEGLFIEEKVNNYDAYPVIRGGIRSVDHDVQIGNRASGGGE